MAEMSIYWVAGPRFSLVGRESTWCEVLYKWLRGEKTTLQQEEDAIQAQKELQMECCAGYDYWFVGRARKFFGHEACVLWAPPEDYKQVDEDYLTPFDTGLLGLNMFNLETDCSPSSVYSHHRKVLRDWKPHFQCHLEHQPYSEYVNAAQRFECDCFYNGICSVNEVKCCEYGWRASSIEDGMWTWEVHIARSSSNAQNFLPFPEVLVIERSEYTKFKKWVARNVGQGDRQGLQNWIDAASNAVVTFGGDTRINGNIGHGSAWAAANDYLIELWGS